MLLKVLGSRPSTRFTSHLKSQVSRLFLASKRKYSFAVGPSSYSLPPQASGLVTIGRMVTLASSTLNESYVEPSPYAWLRTCAPVPTTYAPACEPLYPFQEILENRTSRARGMTGSCTEVVERKFSICIEIWQVELESCVWRVSFHKYAYVHGDPIQGIDPTGEFFALGALALGLQMNSMTLLQGGVVAEIVSTFGDAGTKLRNRGIEMMATGAFDDGLELYMMGSTIISVSFNAAEQTAGLVGLMAFAPVVGGLAVAASRVGMVRGAISNAVRAIRSAADDLVNGGSQLAQAASQSLKRAAPAAAKGIDDMADKMDDIEVLWGQKRIGPTFSTERVVPPSLRGRSLVDVSDDIRSGKISTDDIPVHYFVDSHGRNIAINNRGLAAITMAGKQPTKLIQVQPTRNELRRLTELPIDRFHLVPGNRVAVTTNRNGTGHLYTVFTN